MGNVINAMCFRNPEATLARFVPMLHTRIVTEPRGKSDLEWCLAIAQGLVFRGREHLIRHEEAFKSMAKAVINHEKRELREDGLDLLSALMEGLTTVWPAEYTAYGDRDMTEPLAVEWHLPSTDELDMAHRIFETFSSEAIQTIENILAEDKRGNLGALETPLLALEAFMQGGRMLGGMPEDPSSAEDSDNDDGEEQENDDGFNDYQSNRVYGVAGVGWGESPASKAAYLTFRRALCSFIRRVATRLLDDREEAPKSLTALVRLIEEVLNGRLRREGFTQVNQKYTALKYATEELHRGKEHRPRPLRVTKVYLQHLRQHSQTVKRLPKGPDENVLLSTLLEVSLCRYRSLRTKAQHTLHTAYGRYRGAMQNDVKALLAVIEEDTISEGLSEQKQAKARGRLKGALFSLQNKAVVKKIGYGALLPRFLKAMLLGSKQDDIKIQATFAALFEFFVASASSPRRDDVWSAKQRGSHEAAVQELCTMLSVESGGRLI